MAQRKLLMIPGPTEFDESVLAALGEPSPSHVAPDFISQFSETLKLLRTILFANKDCQPFVLSGGGAIGWDCIVSSLCDSSKRDRALIINTGYFSDNFATCCDHYDVECDHVRASIGGVVTPESLEEFFENDEKNSSSDSTKKSKKYKLVCITHVDTSTAIVNPIRELSEVIRKYCDKSTLIAVDGVCSFAGERFYFSKWGIDACMTASQKALGVPPGLCVMMLSNKAVNVMKKRNPDSKSKVRSYYTDLNNWLPIMQKYEAKQPSYFSTPNTNLIKALRVSCKKLIATGMEKTFDQHYLLSNAFKDSMEALGLGFVPHSREIMANTLTAIRYPADVDGKKLLGFIKEYGVIFAGGLHKDIKSEYFRVGHMGISTNEGCDHLLTCVKAVEYGLNKVGYKFEPNIGVNTLLKTVVISEKSSYVENHNSSGCGMKSCCNTQNSNNNYNGGHAMFQHNGCNCYDCSHSRQCPYLMTHSSNHYGAKDSSNDKNNVFMSSFCGIAAGLALGYVIAKQLKKKT